MPRSFGDLTAPVRLGLYAVTLVIVFVLAFTIAGAVTGPTMIDPAPGHDGHTGQGGHTGHDGQNEEGGDDHN